VHFESGLLSGDARIVSDLPLLESREAPGNAATVREAAARLMAAQRPVILAGQGAHGSADALRTLIERLGAPVATTSSGRGVLPEDHPLALGFDALRGGLDALNELFAESDCIVALGAKLGHNGSAGFGLRLPADRLIHVDADGAVLGANYSATLSIECTVDAFVSAALAAGRDVGLGRWDAEAIRRYRDRCRAVTAGDPPEPVIHGADGGSAGEFFAALRRALPGDGILVTDSGLHQVLARRHFEVRTPRGLVLPSDFQSMGYGIPAAIGVKLAAPQRPVVAIVGDGGFLMTGMELVTAVRERIPLTVIVFNDGQLNLIRLQQLREFGRSHAVELRTPDLAGFAAAIGAAYLPFGVGNDAEGTLREAVRSPKGPVLVEVRVGDSAAVHALRTEGLARETVRRALGPRAIGWIKRLLGR
jgi:acetolactate synthase-1/2/3 large subunit